MGGLKQDLSVTQGVGLLATSLLGSGVFAVPALAAQLAQQDSLWAWPILVLLVFPVALTFAALGRHFPSTGGAAHFLGIAFGPRMAKATGWLFLSVIPVGLPAALKIASGFWQALFGWSATGLLLVEIATLVIIWYVGTRSAGSSANLQTLIVLLIVGMLAAIWWKGGINPTEIHWPSLMQVSPVNLSSALAVMFWCFVGLEAFAHMATEFRQPERDFPRALIIGLLLAGIVYWACTVAVLHFHSYGIHQAAAASLPSIIVTLFGKSALWIACVIGYLACFASVNIYAQSFARLVWTQAQLKPSSNLAKLSRSGMPVNAMSLVVGSCLVCVIAAYLMAIPLDILMVYANGIFVFIYFLCMIAGCRILQKRSRWMAIFGAILCAGLLAMIGWKSLYAIGIFCAIWLFLRISDKALPSTNTR